MPRGNSQARSGVDLLRVARGAGPPPASTMELRGGLGVALRASPAAVAAPSSGARGARPIGGRARRGSEEWSQALQRLEEQRGGAAEAVASRAAIHACAKERRWKGALGVLQAMWERGLEPDTRRAGELICLGPFSFALCRVPFRSFPHEVT